MSEIPYMMANTPEEAERVRLLAARRHDEEAAALREGDGGGATEEDRARAAELFVLARTDHDHLYAKRRIAAALADERKRAQVPFRALADDAECMGLHVFAARMRRAAAAPRPTHPTRNDEEQGDG